jgi:predicted nucleotidyltransferase component of viral defense system
VLRAEEMRAVAERFGVAEEQVRRDHLVSHLLVAVAGAVPDVVFFGGTALARTHLPDGRLSEDVDLYATPRTEAAKRLATAVPRALHREFPGATWNPAPDAVRPPSSALLVTPRAGAVRLQVLDGVGYREWLTERRPVDLRYSDVPPVSLTVPTRAAFVGMKAWAWFDRHAARDLYDLWALASIGAVDDEAASTFHRAVGVTLAPHLFERAPTPEEWRSALAHQTANLPTVDEAVAVVRTAIAALG